MTVLSVAKWLSWRRVHGSFLNIFDFYVRLGALCDAFWRRTIIDLFNWS